MGKKRDKLRAGVLSPKAGRSRIIVEHDGEKYEVRAPTVKGRVRILEFSGVEYDEDQNIRKGDVADVQVAAVIKSVFEPGTNELVFEPGDREALGEAEAGGVVDRLSEAAMSFMRVREIGEDLKNAPSDSCSTKSQKESGVGQ